MGNVWSLLFGAEQPPGRTLMLGLDNAGKPTLLRLIGGKHMVADGQLHVLGREAFGDTKLNTLVSMLSGDWTRQVAGFTKQMRQMSSCCFCFERKLLEYNKN